MNVPAEQREYTSLKAKTPCSAAKTPIDASSDDEFYRRVIDFCYQPTPWPSHGAFDAAGFRAALEAFYRHASFK